MQRHNGFTIVELLIVIAIILILSAIAIPKFTTSSTISRTRNSYEIVDNFINNMFPARIAFNTPLQMKMNKTRCIKLILSTNESIDSLIMDLENEGQVNSEEIKISNVVEARLTGQNFNILSITPEKQAISSLERTIWQWDIQGTKKGKQKLHLTLSSFVSINGENTSKAIRTFDREIEVKIEKIDIFKKFIKSNWQWLWVTFMIPVFTIAYRKRNILFSYKK